MKYIFLTALILFVGSLTFGCGSAPANDANVSKNSNSGSNAAPANQNTAGIPTGDQTAIVDANAPPAGKIGMANRREIVDGPAGAVPPPVPRPAGENSEFTTEMLKSGAIFERRVFKNDPQLAKVEATWTNPKQRTTKIFLKNGRVVTTDRIESVHDVSTATLREIAGIKPPPPPKAPDGSSGNEKKKPTQ